MQSSNFPAIVSLCCMLASIAFFTSASAKPTSSGSIEQQKPIVVAGIEEETEQDPLVMVFAELPIHEQAALLKLHYRPGNLFGTKQHQIQMDGDFDSAPRLKKWSRFEPSIRFY